MLNILNNTNTYSVSSFINNKNVPSNTYSYSNVGASTFAGDSYSLTRTTSNLTPFSSNNVGVVQRDTSNFFNAEGFIMAGLVLGLGGISAGIGAGIGALFGNAKLGAIIGFSAAVAVPTVSFGRGLYYHFKSN